MITGIRATFPSILSLYESLHGPVVMLIKHLLYSPVSAESFEVL
jgi:hypothetical protein